MNRVFLLAVLMAGSAAAQSGWTPELSMQIRSTGEVLPSPDGSMVAYTVSEWVMEAEVSERRTHVWTASADGSRQVQLTRGEKSATQPEFAPDGRTVFFLSSRSGKPNIWRIPVSGGEAEQWTDWKGEIARFHLSPDGQWLAFAGREANERMEQARKEKRDFRVIDEDPPVNGLWVVAAQGEPRRPARKLAGLKRHVNAFTWSPDSSRLAVEHWPGPDPEGVFRADLSEVDRESGEARVLANTPAGETSPAYSPDGRSLAYTRITQRWAGECRFVLMPVSGGAGRELPLTFDECGRGTNLLGFSQSGREILYTETVRTRNAIRAMPLDGPPRDLYMPAKGTLTSYGGSARLNRRGTHVGFAFETLTSPTEVHLLTVASGKAARAASPNAGLPLPPAPETAVVRWKAKDGLEIEGLLTYPAGYRKGTRYPLALVIHGGPMGVFTETYQGNANLYPVASFASQGWAVLQPNPRGSSGYGGKFRFANYNDWGFGDYDDIMTGVDHAIALGLADADRMAVMGWSYGGYMTSWVVGQTKRFKAAAVGAGVTNLWSFTGTADIPGFMPDYFSGEPWDNFEAYKKHSPMTYVKGVTTPTLVLHGESDLRVPVSQGYEFYNAMKRQGVKTKMVVYPRMPHGPSEPKFLLDIMHRHMDWAVEHVR
ncbi:MAG: S9 family peptidase [Bryobacterales bacterium]|nr:S9 family peptidase [Bryobacterales bacterium]